MPKKITISNKGVYIDGTEIPGVASAEIRNINPGELGAIEVALILRTAEIDVQYKLWSQRDGEVAVETDGGKITKSVLKAIRGTPPESEAQG